MRRDAQSARGGAQRHLRVGESLRRALSDVFARADLRDPDLEGATITVSEVRMSPDLRHATVFVVPLGGDRNAEIEAALNQRGIEDRRIRRREFMQRICEHGLLVLGQAEASAELREPRGCGDTHVGGRALDAGVSCPHRRMPRDRKELSGHAEVGDTPSANAAIGPWLIYDPFDYFMEVVK